MGLEPQPLNIWLVIHTYPLCLWLKIHHLTCTHLSLGVFISLTMTLLLISVCHNNIAAEISGPQYWKPNPSKKDMKISKEYYGKTIDLVIKKSDKGSCIVVQDWSTYVAEGKSHLANTSTYRPLDADPTTSIAKDIRERVDSMKEAGYIHKCLPASLRQGNNSMHVLP